MSTRQNDWAAVLLNISNTENIDLGEDPMKTLYENGITPENTELKDEDYYKNIPQVVNSFTRHRRYSQKSETISALSNPIPSPSFLPWLPHL